MLSITRAIFSKSTKPLTLAIGSRNYGLFMGPNNFGARQISQTQLSLKNHVPQRLHFCTNNPTDNVTSDEISDSDIDFAPKSVTLMTEDQLLKYPTLYVVENELNPLDIGIEVRTLDLFAHCFVEDMGISLVDESVNPPHVKLVDIFYAVEVYKQKKDRTYVPMQEKEVLFSSVLTQHDLDTKMEKIKEFLESNHKVIICIQHARRTTDVNCPVQRMQTFKRIRKEFLEYGVAEIAISLNPKKITWTIRVDPSRAGKIDTFRYMYPNKEDNIPVPSPDILALRKLQKKKAELKSLKNTLPEFDEFDEPEDDHPERF